MHRCQSYLLPRIPILIAAVSLLCSLALSQTSSERESVLHALTLSYGPSLDEQHPRFAIKTNYVLVPSFSGDGLLIEISIEPKSSGHSSHVSQLSRSELDSLLAALASIKPSGAFEQDYGVKFRSGWRVHGRQAYHNEYLETAELRGEGQPLPIESARNYYLHSVTGVSKIEPVQTPETFPSFVLVCVEGEHYITPRSEFIKLWSKPNVPQTVDAAGPTGAPCAPDEVLFKRSATAMESHKFSVAHLTLETLINTYPDSDTHIRQRHSWQIPELPSAAEDGSPPTRATGTEPEHCRTTKHSRH